MFGAGEGFGGLPEAGEPVLFVISFLSVYQRNLNVNARPYFCLFLFLLSFPDSIEI